MASSLSASPTARTLAAVFQINTTGSGDLLSASTFASGYRLNRVTTNGASPFETSYGLSRGSTLIGESTQAANVLVLGAVQADYTTTTYAFRINGASAGSGSHAVSAFAAGLTSKLATGSQFMNGKIAELLAWDGALLSSVDRNAVQVSQKEYWGTP